MKKNIFRASVALSSLFPLVAFAAPQTYGEAVNLLLGLINLLIPIVIGIAIVGFMYGILKYILALGNEHDKTEAREIMLWGVIALFVMFSVWGLVRVLANTFLGGAGSTTSFYGLPIGGEMIQNNQYGYNRQINIPGNL